MDKQHLNTYYPTNETMEDRYFRIAQSRQRIPLRKWIVAAITSLVLGLFFGVIYSISEEEAVTVFCLLYSVAFAISMAGISVYLSGFHFLEKAELLYNTRVAGQEAAAKTVAPVSPDAARLEKLRKLREQDLITEEEYQQAIAKKE